MKGSQHLWQLRGFEKSIVDRDMVQRSVEPVPANDPLWSLMSGLYVAQHQST